MPNPADTLTLADLKNWDRRDQAGNFLPSLAVLGHPVAHSVSPQMHNAALAELAKTHPELKDWRYFKFDIKPEELADTFNLLMAKNFKGVNLTVPHKSETAVLFSRKNVTIDAGKRIEQIYFEPGSEYAVNTVKFLKAKPSVYSTDGFGLIKAIKRDLELDLSNKTVVILGSGGAITGAAYGIAQECLIQKCATLWIGGRDEQKRLILAQRIINYINSIFHPEMASIVEVLAFALSDPPVNKWPEDVVVINATTLGMKRNDPLPFDVSLLGKKASVFDMVYNQEGPTAFVAAAKASGLRAADGLGMLVWQGAKSLSIWLQGEEGIDITPESIAQTMMDAACAALGLPPRHA